MKGIRNCLWFFGSLLAIACLPALVLWLGYTATMAGHPLFILPIAIIAAWLLYMISPFIYPPPVRRLDTNLKGIDDFSFADACLLGIRERPDFELDMYVYLCGNATLVFPNTRRVHWIQREMKANIDAEGAIDYGDFDFVLRRGDEDIYVIKGDFGKLEVESEYPFVRRAEDFSGWK